MKSRELDFFNFPAELFHLSGHNSDKSKVSWWIAQSKQKNVSRAFGFWFSNAVEFVESSAKNKIHPSVLSYKRKSSNRIYQTSSKFNQKCTTLIQHSKTRKKRNFNFKKLVSRNVRRTFLSVLTKLEFLTLCFRFYVHHWENNRTVTWTSLMREGNYAWRCRNKAQEC